MSGARGSGLVIGFLALGLAAAATALSHATSVQAETASAGSGDVKIA
jgi:hypothetical protein